MAGLDLNTLLLLHFDGQDGGKEIVDDGNTGHVVTQIATATLSTAQKKFGSTSLLCDGDSDYLSVADSDDWAFGTGNFTIDGRFRFSALPASGANVYLYSQRVDTFNQCIVVLGNTGGTYWLKIQVTTATVVIINKSENLSPQPSVDTWYHLAAVRNGNAWSLYQDGTELGTATTASGSVGNMAQPLYIGSNAGAGSFMDGYIDEFRVSNTARWTTGFTPATEEYTSDANTKLLLHMNTQDVSGDGGSDAYHIPTFVATAQLDTAVKKFGSGSLLLDGDSDSVSFPDSADWYFDTADFTIDGRFRFVSLPADNYYLYSQRVDGTNQINFTIFNNGGSYELRLYVNTASVSIIAKIETMSPQPSVDTWYHFAAVRSGNDWSIYQDGTELGTATSASGSVGNYAEPLYLGSNKGASSFMDGYIDELRVSDKARWIANFTPPTAAYSVTTKRLFRAVIF